QAPTVNARSTKGRAAAGPHIPPISMHALQESVLFPFLEVFRFIGQRVLKQRDWSRLVPNRVNVAVVKPQKNPLRPFEILRVRRINLAAPIVAEPKRFYLPLEIGYIFL